MTPQVDQLFKPFEEVGVCRRAMVVTQDVPFMYLARCNKDDSEFVRVNDGHSVQRTGKGGRRGEDRRGAVLFLLLVGADHVGEQPW